MQWDDDSYVTGPVPYDLVRHMREGGYVLGARRLMREHAPVVWGLAELIKYFLLTHKGGSAGYGAACILPRS